MAIDLVIARPDDAVALAALARWAEPWRHVFAHSMVISTGVLFAHVASLVCAAGPSLVADRASLRSSGAGEEHALMSLVAHRRFASRALVAVVLSGVVLFLSDVEAFAGLPTFWLKMSLVVLLLTNSVFAQRCEQQLPVAGNASGSRRRARASRHGVHAGVSVVLWMCTILAGTALMAG